MNSFQMTRDADWLQFFSIFGQHRFQDNGERNKPHHFTDYVYPDNKLLEEVRNLSPATLGTGSFQPLLHRPHNQNNRREPGPKPPSWEDCKYFSITEAVAHSTPKHIIEKDQQNADFYHCKRESSDGERLEHDMDRVSKYAGRTSLGLVFGHHQVFIRRSTDLKIINEDIPVREVQTYSLMPPEWPKLGARLRQAECQRQPLKAWWERLETLRLAKTDRAYHSVLHAVEAIGKLDQYKRLGLWKPPPIDPVLTYVWKDELGDSEEDRRCLICFNDLEFKGNDRAVRLDCNHVFGMKCIKKWVKSSNPPKPCPVCRTALRTLPPRPTTPPPVFGPLDPQVTINCAILLDWYKEFKAKEEASTYAEARFNPIFCTEVKVMEEVFNAVLPPEDGRSYSPQHFSISLQRAVSGKLRQLLNFSEFPSLRDYLFPGFEKLCGRVCDGMAARLLEERMRHDDGDEIM